MDLIYFGNKYSNPEFIVDNDVYKTKKVKFDFTQDDEEKFKAAQINKQYLNNNNNQKKKKNSKKKQQKDKEFFLRFKQIQCGARFTCVIDVLDRLWVFGFGNDGELGDKTLGNFAKKPECLSRLIVKNKTTNFQDVSCGQDYVFALTTNNKLYCWGNGQQRKLGLDTDGQDTNIQLPVEISETRIAPALNSEQFEEFDNWQSLENIKTQQSEFNRQSSQNFIKFGGFQNKSSIGNQEFMRQGTAISSISNFTKYNQRRRINQINQIEKAYCGFTHTYVKVSYNNSYNSCFIGFGLDVRGKLGDNNYEEALINPQVIRSLSMLNIQGISVGKFHCLAWLTNGTVFTWGDGIDGKLGHPIDFKSGKGFEKVVASPQYLESLSNQFVIQGVVGLNQSLVLTDKGEIYQWGKGDYSVNVNNQLVPQIQHVITPQKLKILQWKTEIKCDFCLGNLTKKTVEEHQTKYAHMNIDKKNQEYKCMVCGEEQKPKDYNMICINFDIDCLGPIFNVCMPCYGKGEQNKRRYFQCNECKWELKKVNLNDINPHTVVDYKCEICGSTKQDKITMHHYQYCQKQECHLSDYRQTFDICNPCHLRGEIGKRVNNKVYKCDYCKSELMKSIEPNFQVKQDVKCINCQILIGDQEIVFSCNCNVKGFAVCKQCYFIGDLRQIFEIKFIKIASGYTHNLAISNKQQLYSWGDCTEGALGHQDEKTEPEDLIDAFEPKLVERYQHLKIYDIACGNHFSIALTSENNSKNLIQSQEYLKYQDNNARQFFKRQQQFNIYTKQKQELYNLDRKQIKEKYKSQGNTEFLSKVKAQNTYQNKINELKLSFISSSELQNKTTKTQLNQEVSPKMRGKNFERSEKSRKNTFFKQGTSYDQLARKQSIILEQNQLVQKTMGLASPKNSIFQNKSRQSTILIQSPSKKSMSNLERNEDLYGIQQTQQKYRQSRYSKTATTHQKVLDSIFQLDQNQGQSGKMRKSAYITEGNDNSNSKHLRFSTKISNQYSPLKTESKNKYSQHESQNVIVEQEQQNNYDDSEEEIILSIAQQEQKKQIQEQQDKILKLVTNQPIHIQDEQNEDQNEFQLPQKKVNKKQQNFRVQKTSNMSSAHSLKHKSTTNLNQKINNHLNSDNKKFKTSDNFFKQNRKYKNKIFELEDLGDNFSENQKQILQNQSLYFNKNKTREKEESRDNVCKEIMLVK